LPPTLGDLMLGNVNVAPRIQARQPDNECAHERSLLVALVRPSNGRAMHQPGGPCLRRGRAQTERVARHRRHRRWSIVTPNWPGGEALCPRREGWSRQRRSTWQAHLSASAKLGTGSTTHPRRGILGRSERSGLRLPAWRLAGVGSPGRDWELRDLGRPVRRDHDPGGAK
jgi:hypothetical protein